MKSLNNKIIVRCDPFQKNTFKIGDVEIYPALLFEINYREKSPVICQAESYNDIIRKGDILLCHHNTFYGNSPYRLQGDLYSIPENGNIVFCKLNVHDGSLSPLYGNIMCDTVQVESTLELPERERKYHIDRSTVINPGYTEYSQGQLIFHRPYGNYCIVYNWNKALIRTWKVHESQICGVLV